MIGKVIYSSNGNYKVLFEGRVYNAKTLGVLRKEKIHIIVGDIVEFDINENKKGLAEINVIKALKPRKNVFERPKISNVDNAIIVTSITATKFNDYYLDKLITIFQFNNVIPILIFTKKDLIKNEKDLKTIYEYKDMGYEVLITDGFLKNEQVKKIKDLTKNKFSVITGQSGVGKSTLLNLLNPNLKLTTASVSEATGRGKHTTTHTEIFEVFKNCFFIDTPGFSSLELKEIDENILS